MAESDVQISGKELKEILEAHFDSRFAMLEKWIERVSTAVEGLVAQRDRLVVLETHTTQIKTDIIEIKSKDERQDNKISQIDKQVLKLTVYAGVVSAISAVVISIVLKMFGVG